MIRTSLALLTLVSTTFGVVQDKVDVIDLGEGRQPRLAIAMDGTAYVVSGGNGAVFCSQSVDGGRSWTASGRVESLTGNIPLGMHRGPRFCVADDAIVITEIVGDKGGGADGDLVAVRSTDKGKHWSKPIEVSDTHGAAREGLHGIASNGRDRLAAVWLDLRDGKTTVMSSVSDDRGATWSKNVLVYRSPDGHVCECCHPSVTLDGDGNIHVMFRNWLGGNRDMYLATSRDDGKTWTPAKKLGTGNWPLNACPMDGGDIGSFNQDVWTAWQRNGSVFVATAAEPAEKKLDGGRQPTLSATSDGVWFAYLKGRDLWVHPKLNHPFMLAKDADAPMLTAFSDHVYCVWESAGHSFLAVLK